VVAAADGKAGLEAALSSEFDFVILDVMLPKMDGTAVCRSLRDKGFSRPIIMLTAKGSVEDRVQGLDAGADDYLLKPFAFSELLARIRAIGRRNSDEAPGQLEVGGLEIDLVRHKVRYKTEELDLTTREFTLLQHLMRRKGHVLSRTMIIESVWGYDFNAGTNIIDVYINFLRRKLRKLTGKEWIRTLRNRGYVFEEPEA
jgi:DNA-binding response OmpR family regulator